ncbi:MAG: arylsulfatase [Hyphomicrobiales bacterium]|nr:arylsulfatase [Hyphomicrobiales bacterium]
MRSANLSCCFLASIGLLFGSAASADERPNILLVMADDLGWSDIGPYGGEIDTPNLDALAEAGMLFTDFHASVSCSPTRAMLLSGNDNHIAGLGTMSEMLVANQVGEPGYEGHLNDRVASMAEVLRDAGYHTIMSGKWHLGHEQGTLPFDRGFDSTLTMLVGGASHWADRLGILPDDDPAKYAMNGEHIKTLPEDFYSSRSYADRLIDEIRARRGDDRPFFAYLAFTAPHDPVHAPEPWLSKYAGRYDEGYEVLKKDRWATAKELGLVPVDAPLPELLPFVTPWSELTEEDQALEKRGMEVYSGMVDAMDYHYGRVVDFLADIGELDNTIIIFLSDNGSNPFYSADYPDAGNPEFVAKFDHSLENLGRPGSNFAYGPGFASGSSGPLDYFKQTVGEGGIRVPLIIAGPGIPEGEVTDAFAYVWDILPTLLDMTGAKYPAERNGMKLEQPRGRSMAPLFADTALEIYGPDELVAGEMAGGKWIRQGSYKAVSVPAPYGDGEWRLYDVEKDPGETTDLASDMPDLLGFLMAAWNDYSEDVGVVPAILN